MAKRKDDSPDKDKGQDLLDDLSSPGMGKGEDLDEEGQPKDKGAVESPEGGQEEAEELSPKVQELLKKKGFKSLEELADSYSSLESQTTRLSQERRLKFIPSGPEFQPGFPVEGRKEKPLDIKLPKGIYEQITDDEKALGVFSTFGEQILNRAKSDLREEYTQEKMREMRVAIEVKRAQDPEKFDRLTPTMADLSRRFPHATLDQVYAEADEIEKENRGRIEKDSESKFRKMIREEMNAISNPPAISEGGGARPGESRGKDKAKSEVDKFMDEIAKADKLQS